MASAGKNSKNNQEYRQYRREVEGAQLADQMAAKLPGTDSRLIGREQ